MGYLTVFALKSEAALISRNEPKQQLVELNFELANKRAVCIYITSNDVTHIDLAISINKYIRNSNMSKNKTSEKEQE